MPCRVGDDGRQHQVLLRRQARENAALFGAVADAQVRDLVRAACSIVSRAVDLDRALARAGQAHDRAQRGGAARAVAAEQRDHFALVHDEVDAVQHVRFAVPGVQAFDAKRSSACNVLPARSPSVVPM